VQKLFSIQHSIVDEQQLKMRRAAILLFAVFIVVGGTILLLVSDVGAGLPYFFLIPWVIGLSVVLVIPSAVFLQKGTFSFANPVVFATWSYFFPAFVVGGLLLCFGWSQPYFLDHIQDPETELPYTVVLIALGFAALSIGYMLPVGAYLGRKIDQYLPVFDLPLRSYFTPGLVLLGFGMMSVIVAMVLGLAGFQVLDQMSSYDGLIIASTQLWMEAIFLLWLVILRMPTGNLQSYIIAGGVLFTFFIRALYAGNRGSLLQLFITVFLAYVLAGRVIRLKQGVWASIALALCVIVGVIYGTTFRSVKGEESAVSVDRYTGSIFDTFSEVRRNNSMDLLNFASGALAERLDTLSSVAVVVSNYEQLAPYEEQYGLQNNILNDLATFAIPRVIWNDKPVSSDARQYSDLYFDYGQNSFAITPIGDLLRNFGPIGVPIGMLILGILLRSIYTALIDIGSVVPWRATLYFILLMSVSYESFYGLIIPNLVKNGFVASLGILIVYFVSRRISSSKLWSIESSVLAP
jgi:hypothetical protein